MNNSPHPSPSVLERVLLRSPTAYVRQGGVLLGCIYIYARCGGALTGAYGVPSTCSSVEGVLSWVHV